VDQYQASKISDPTRFSLSDVYKMRDSLFQIVNKKGEEISGIVVPWAYVAGQFSTFCWHTEDLFLYSLNFMHEGGTKTWYCIPYSDVEKVREFLLVKYKDKLAEKPTLLNEVIIFFSPLELV
jgi:JmjC domain, hydroxylase